MATYSTSLQIKLITDGTESGVWGTSTNTNWNLIEQAVAGVQSITMLNADYTLTVVNGGSDEARNAVLVVTGTNSAIRKIVIPAVTKVYVVYNNTTGGYAITIGTSGGSVVTVPNGAATLVYCDATNTYAGVSGSAGNFAIAGNETVAGSSTITGNLSVGGTTTLTGNATAPTQSSSDNSTKVATTAYVTTAVTNATGSLGTMSTQNANAVAITGGTISGLGTPLPVASGGTGLATITSNNVILGNGTSAVQVVAPSTAGKILTSDGTTWTAASPVTLGAGTVSSGSSFNITTGASGKCLIQIHANVYATYGSFGSGTVSMVISGSTVASTTTRTMEYDSRTSGSTPTISYLYSGSPNATVSVTYSYSGPGGAYDSYYSYHGA